jgi:histidinol-phosphate aminotransferase
VPLNDRHEHDLDAMLAEITVATRMVIVCNPNNPTSTAVGLEELRAFVEAVPRHVCVVLDEAYCEFTTLEDPDATVDLLPRHPNLVLLRTFSKIYGLAGLRVGYALAGDEAFVTAVNQVRQPFFCSAAAQAAAVEALKHQDAVAERVERAIIARVELESGLHDLGILPAESQANFSWFDLPEDGPPRRTSSRASPRAGCSCGRGRRSAGRARCGSPTARRSRTSASCGAGELLGR